MNLYNKNTKQEDFNNIKNIIISKYPNLNADNITAIFAKELPNADLILNNKTTNTSGKTTHIACTGDSRKFFLSILGDIVLKNSQLSGEDTFPIYVETKFLPNNSTNSSPFILSKCTIWINCKSEDNQIGLSKDAFDGNEFKILRTKMKLNDILIFFKYLDNGIINIYSVLLKNDVDANDIAKIKPITNRPKYFESLIKNINIPTSNLITNLKGMNKIYYGAPGTGKSKYVNDTYYDDTFAKRVTFHPEYSYYDFIGCTKPFVNNNGDLKYEFIPGAFTEILLCALKDPNNMYTLIIEELNRANTSAVFGDIFQLLDRDANSISEYPVNNIDIIKYIKKEFDQNYTSVVIPNNLNIIATMNTADQNVFTMDTAFKRRWEFEYLPIEFEDNHPFKNNLISNLNISWEKFVTEINKFMMSSDNMDLMISEDKQLGPYFVKKTELDNPKKFGYKVFLYLWDDVFKIDRARIFNNQIRTFTDLITQFEKGNSSNIFNTNLFEKLQKHVDKNTEENFDLLDFNIDDLE